jgi:serine protease Do
MRYSGLRALVIAASVLGSVATLLPVQGSAQSLRDLLPFGRTHRIAKLLRTVVNISTHKMSHSVADKTSDAAAAGSGASEPQRIEAFGSGFVIDPAGLIVTNRHVIEGALDVTVTLSDGTSMPAKVRGFGRSIDIALLEVTPPKPLPAVTWADSDKVRVGDQVLAVGNPLGIGESVSAGIVSAKNRDTLDTPFDDYIQTDAAINHGNSGGPLCDTRGEVIGVNTAIYTPFEQSGSIGIGFAIPGNDARTAVNQLRQYGRLRLGWLGVRAQDVTPDISDAFGLPVSYGAIVVDVDADGPASHAGLRVGDVILKFNKQETKDARELARIVSNSAIGDPDAVLVWRDRKEQTISATVGEWASERPPAEDPAVKPAKAEHVDPPDLGLQTSEITEELRAKYKLAAKQPGILVTGVTPSSAADEAGLAVGSVILRVQQEPVATTADMLTLFKQVRSEQRHHVVVLVQDNHGLRWVPLYVGTVR